MSKGRKLKRYGAIGRVGRMADEVASDSLFIQTKECDGKCGSKVEVTVASKRQRGSTVGDLMGVLELLGWKTVTTGKRTMVFCDYCQDKAKLIVEGQ